MCLALLFAALADPITHEQRKSLPPPSTVLIRGGRTTIGTPSSEVLTVGEKDQLSFEKLACETPEHEVKVEDFFFGVTEVTNEQYLAFVQATGHKPPQEWGRDAIDEAVRRFTEQTGTLRDQAESAGLAPPERAAFDETAWWDGHWASATWQIPDGRASCPVTFIDYDDARAYARWAGVRLMSEEEFQRAARGKTSRVYPWGDAWDDSKYCANQAQRTNMPSPVARFPLGATEDGVYDLAGNVWEWTSSPFSPYPGWKVLQVRIGTGAKERVIDGLVPWDSNQRISVGGSFQNQSLACRVATRRPTDRLQHTNAVGFRVAASPEPGLDMAMAILSRELPEDRRAPGVIYDPENSVILDRWSTWPGMARTLDKQGQEIPIASYAVTTGYDALLFLPVKEVDAVAVKDLEQRSAAGGPIPVGVFATTRPILTPSLVPGVYAVSWRAAGPPTDSRRTEGPSADRDGYPVGMDLAVDNFLFTPLLDPAAPAKQDAPLPGVAFLPANPLEASHPATPAVRVSAGVRDAVQEVAAGQPIVSKEDVDVAEFQLSALAKVSNRGFNFALQFQLPHGALDESWRR